MTPNETYSGPERRTNTLRKWRWKVLTIWIVIFSALNILNTISQRNVSTNNHSIAVKAAKLARSNKMSIKAINKNRVNIGALQATNCSLKKFLLSARAARIAASKIDKGSKSANDLRAADSYEAIVKPFTVEATGVCIIPRSLQIKH